MNVHDAKIRVAQLIRGFNTNSMRVQYESLSSISAWNFKIVTSLKNFKRIISLNIAKFGNSKPVKVSKLKSTLIHITIDRCLIAA